MCIGCYEEYGSPRVCTPAVVHAAGIVAAVFGHNCMGGNLHAQLEDWNIDDEFWVEFRVWDDKSTAAQVETERVCFELFKAMSLIERASALGLHDEFWSLGDNETHLAR